MAARLFKSRFDERPRGSTRSSDNSRRPYSYYSSKAPTRPGGEGRRSTNRPNKLRMVPTILALLAIFISIVYSTTLTDKPGINFAGDPSPYRSSQEYQKLADKILGRSIFNRSKLTINTSDFNARLLKEAPELDAAKLVLPIIGRRPTLTLHARQPALILTTKTAALILDSSGLAVSDTRALPSSQREKLLTLQDDSGLKIDPGKQAITSETVEFVLNLKHQLDDKNLKINRLVLPSTPNEVDIYIEGLSYFVKTDVTGDARLQVGAFLAAKDKIGGKGPSEYIDVRVEEKVFYK